MQLTSRQHLADLIRAVHARIKDALAGGRFADAEALRVELAWLSQQLGGQWYTRL